MAHPSSAPAFGVGSVSAENGLLRCPSPASTPGPLTSSSGGSSRYLFSERRRTLATRNFSFASALISALCAGSVAVFSLYGHIFQERLHYTQLQVNGVAMAASVATYLPVPVFGYVCDRFGPAPLSLLAAVLFGGGYGMAAVLYRRAEGGSASGRNLGHSMEYAAMAAAFTAIGVGTCAMYLSAVATCAKNFGKGRHRGLALAAPIAAYGLSGMWQSQVGSLFLCEWMPDGTRGDVDVVRLFTFLSLLLFTVGALGTFGLRIAQEQELICDAVEELERSGPLERSAFLTPGRVQHGYGAIERTDRITEENAGTLDPSERDDDSNSWFKKQRLVNAETRQFLTDHTMWCFALGFFFMIGPAEAFLNNLGTIIQTLYPPSLYIAGRPTSPATHVSIVGITSTAVRLLTGTLSDLLAPSPQAPHMQMASSTQLQTRMPFAVSRVVLLLFFALLLSAGLATLAAGFAQGHGERFWVVSGLVGSGYGAVFSLTPIIITVVWGVENFATHWGIVAMFPALGATLWGVVYSGVYEAGVIKPAARDGDEGLFCHGKACYSGAFWPMAGSVWVAAGLVMWAWKGRNGWAERGILI